MGSNVLGHAHPHRRRPAVGLALALLLAACGPGGGGAQSAQPDVSASAPVAPSPVASEAPAAAAAPSPTPSASPGTAQRLRSAIAAGSPWQAEATMEGTAGGDLAKTAGTFAIRGDDWTMTITMTAAGSEHTTEQLVVGGENYLRAPGGTWRHDLPENGFVPVPTLRRALASASFTEPQPGRLETTGDDAVAVAYALGMSDPSVRCENAVVTLALDARGSPATMHLGFDGILGRYEIDYTFDSEPEVAAFAAPGDAVALAVESGKFTLLYPDGWTHRSLGEGSDVFDVFQPPDSSEVLFVYCVDSEASLKRWTALGRADYSEQWAATPTHTESGTFGDVTWNLSEWAKATIDGKKSSAMVAASVHNGLACDIAWYGAPRTSTDARVPPAFVQVLNSFVYRN